MAKYTLSTHAFKKLAGTEVYRRLDEVLDKAAIVSHPRGNRRYHNWVFRVMGTVVEDACRITDEAPPLQADEFMVWEECPDCEARRPLMHGCPTCKGKGEVQVRRRLPSFDKRRAAR